MATDRMQWNLNLPRYARPLAVKRAVLPLVLSATGRDLSQVLSCHSAVPPAGVAWRLVLRLRAPSGAG